MICALAAFLHAAVADGYISPIVGSWDDRVLVSRGRGRAALRAHCFRQCAPGSCPPVSFEHARCLKKTECRVTAYGPTHHSAPNYCRRMRKSSGAPVFIHPSGLVTFLMAQYQFTECGKDNKCTNHDPEYAHGNDQTHAGDTGVRRER